MAVKKRKKQLPSHAHTRHVKGVIVIDKADVKVSSEFGDNSRLTLKELYLTPALFLTPIIIYILMIAWMIRQS